MSRTLIYYGNMEFIKALFYLAGVHAFLKQYPHAFCYMSTHDFLHIVKYKKKAALRREEQNKVNPISLA